MPTARVFANDLLARSTARRLDGESSRSSTRNAYATTGSATLAWGRPRSARTRRRSRPRKDVWEASQALGARSASIHDLYMARARGEVSGFTVPAINIKGPDVSTWPATAFEAALARNGRGGHPRGARASRPIRTSGRSTTRPPSSPGDRRERWGAGVHPGRTTTSSTRENTRRSPSRGPRRSARVPARRRRGLPQHRHRFRRPW